MNHARTLVTALSATLAVGLAASTATAAGDPRPTDQARKAGITQRGQAWMGWTQNAPAKQSTPKPLLASTLGMDVSNWQGDVNWPSYWGQGFKFAYVKATEGDYYVNPRFAQQYNGSYNVGMIRGAYHFGTPNDSGGATQANYFVDHGGGWSRDGKTLPGVLDIEYNPYGATCYGKTTTQMVDWIRAFLNQYKARTTRDAVIYTTTDWWTQCTGNSSAFNQTNPLWIARYNTSPGTLPGGWPFHTIWQFTDSPLDKNYFNGDLSRVIALANG